MQILPLRIGTRNSALALAQAYEVRVRLMEVHNVSSEAFKIVPIVTRGDHTSNHSLSGINGKGLFTREIEKALRQGQIDIAVHSAKDMPAILPDNLHLSAFLKREDPRDVFISAQGNSLYDLPDGATVGSSSIRRQAMIRKLRPNLNIAMLRGNIQTRLAGLQQDNFDGIFLAFAGVKRLGLQKIVTQILDQEQFLPAPGQGAIAVESRIDDASVDAWLTSLSDRVTHYEITCERGFMAALDGSCRTPLGALARVEDEKVHFSGIILTPDGTVFHEVKLHGGIHEAEEVGYEAAKKLKKDANSVFFENW
ncbi:MAG: hydroxymethylbilane synthase [Candidatus Tokpelaia sp. JSC188]|nr:MAG: hydroxymethylbilane synthase [Candidatus Tokpelaia sp. JSC188]